MDFTTIIGIDCATIDKKVGLALAVAEADNCCVHSAEVCSSKREIAEVVVEWLSGSSRALLAFDAPLGWPKAMGELLGAHRAGGPLGIVAHDLFRRETDRFVKRKLGKQSLDVGADRIARTAHSALKLLADLRQKTGLPIPLAWSPHYPEHASAIEVYPAATLKAHGIPNPGYKKKDNRDERKAIIGNLEGLIQLPEDRSTMESNADALDAAICVLAGFDFLQGQAYPPEEMDLSLHEGWIWVRAVPKSG